MRNGTPSCVRYRGSTSSGKSGCFWSRFTARSSNSTGALSRSFMSMSSRVYESLPPDRQTMTRSPASIMLKSWIALPTWWRRRFSSFFWLTESFLAGALMVLFYRTATRYPAIKHGRPRSNSHENQQHRNASCHLGGSDRWAIGECRLGRAPDHHRPRVSGEPVGAVHLGGLRQLPTRRGMDLETATGPPALDKAGAGHLPR